MPAFIKKIDNPKSTIFLHIPFGNCEKGIKLEASLFILFTLTLSMD